MKIDLNVQQNGGISMRKKNDNQLSIFDIEFPQVPVELPAVIPAEIE